MFRSGFHGNFRAAQIVKVTSVTDSSVVLATYRVNKISYSRGDRVLRLFPLGTGEIVTRSLSQMRKDPHQYWEPAGADDTAQSLLAQVGAVNTNNVKAQHAEDVAQWWSVYGKDIWDYRAIWTVGPEQVNLIRYSRDGTLRIALVVVCWREDKTAKNGQRVSLLLSGIARDSVAGTCAPTTAAPLKEFDSLQEALYAVCVE